MSVLVLQRNKFSISEWRLRYVHNSVQSHKKTLKRNWKKYSTPVLQQIKSFYCPRKEINHMNFLSLANKRKSSWKIHSTTHTHTFSPKLRIVKWADFYHSMERSVFSWWIWKKEYMMKRVKRADVNIWQVYSERIHRSNEEAGMWNIRGDGRGIGGP